MAAAILALPGLVASLESPESRDVPEPPELLDRWAPCPRCRACPSQCHLACHALLDLPDPLDPMDPPGLQDPMDSPERLLAEEELAPLDLRDRLDLQATPERLDLLATRELQHREDVEEAEAAAEAGTQAVAQLQEEAEEVRAERQLGSTSTFFRLLIRRLGRWFVPCQARRRLFHWRQWRRR